MVETIPSTIGVIIHEMRLRKILEKFREKTSKDNPKKPDEVLEKNELDVFYNYQKQLKKRGLQKTVDGRYWVE